MSPDKFLPTPNNNSVEKPCLETNFPPTETPSAKPVVNSFEDVKRFVYSLAENNEPKPSTKKPLANLPEKYLL